MRHPERAVPPRGRQHVEHEVIFPAVPARVGAQGLSRGLRVGKTVLVKDVDGRNDDARLPGF